jgi:hypothetical protein
MNRVKIPFPRFRQSDWATGMRRDFYLTAVIKWAWWGWKFRSYVSHETDFLRPDHNPFGWFYAGDDALEKIGIVENETTHALDALLKESLG